jgi:hypothetical protein
MDSHSYSMYTELRYLLIVDTRYEQIFTSNVPDVVLHETCNYERSSLSRLTAAKHIDRQFHRLTCGQITSR